MQCFENTRPKISDSRCVCVCVRASNKELLVKFGAQIKFNHQILVKILDASVIRVAMSYVSD